jgi:Fe-S-cluster-containing dehydrogenase component/DMSO reductase anchor subunit
VTASLVSPGSTLADVVRSRDSKRRLPLVEQFLREQQTLTAVERFAQRHADATEPAREPFYRALLPATPPAPGQQYAFQVDLDACTGCKACVTACHNLNGLDEGETWRSVGLLHGGSTARPMQQTVTTACHHCLEPACMSGCPVGAYEKDPVTGIVKHLDDQCIGCQYCTFTCPYGVPQYNPERGIVRKCDMCSGRLAAGEAPACVQACPSEAISIVVVDKHHAVEDSQGDAFLPGAPSPGITIPTTVYRTERSLPRNMLPADFYAVRPAQQHAPLVAMLVLTQLSVGAFCVDAVASGLLDARTIAVLRPIHSTVALALGIAALGASVLHLGRPLYAFRALIGLRSSWVSREILAFGLFAALGLAQAAALWLAPIARVLGAQGQSALPGAVALAGLGGLACSVFVYHATRRPFWSGPGVGFKFLTTAVILGLATTVLTFRVASAALPAASTDSVARFVATLSSLLVGASGLKLLVEVAFFRHLRRAQYDDRKRAAVLMKRDLRGYALARLALLLLGGVVLPLCFAAEPLGRGVAFAAVSLLLVIAAELLERTLFFAAAVSPAMPGGVS